MISFEKIDKYSLRYAALFRYVRFVHRYIYHSNYDIVGKENLPEKGEATLVISNHQNGLIDALGILFTFRDDRQPVFIARADIFKKETAARLLRFMKIMPAFRTVDVTRSEVGKSAGIFLRAARVLIEGGTVAIFPEAGHESCHHLGTFKKGFPRIAFKAVEESGYELDLKILPMVNYYDNYLNFRQKKTIVIGKPFGFSELYEIYKTKPNDAYLMLNEKCRPVIKEMMLDIEDLNYYDQYDTLRGIYCERLLKRRGKKTSCFPHHLAADKEIVNKLDEIKEEEPARFACLMNKAQHYQEEVRAFRLRNWVINKKVSFGELILKSFIMVLLFPLFLFGLINNYLPFNASRLLTRKIKDHMLYASFHMVIGTLIAFPLFYLLCWITVSLITWNFWFGLIYVLAAFATLFVYYEYKISWIKLKALWRYFFMRKKEGMKQLQKMKRELIAEMDSYLIN